VLEFSACLEVRSGYLDFGLGKVYSFVLNLHHGGLVVDLLLGAVLSVGLAGLGNVIAAFAMWTAYRIELNEIAVKEDRKKIDEELRPKLVVSMTMPTTTVMFAFVIFFMASNKPLMTDDFFYALCGNLGTSGFIVSMAEGFYIGGSMKDVFKYPENWGKSMASVALCEVPIIYCLAIALMSMSIFTGDDSGLFKPNFYVNIASAGSLIAAVLMLRYELKDFKKQILMGLPGVIISTLGFVLAFSYL
jgi:F0F1-type ATP synthase membrane subunit c/vacuolar-type H+-ATPase subunit K